MSFKKKNTFNLVFFKRLVELSGWPGFSSTYVDVRSSWSCSF